VAGVETRQVEEVGRETGQALDLAAHLLEEVPPHGLVHVLVREELQEAAQGEEGRSQLVRGVGDKLAARSVERRKPHPHAVEGAGELSHLVAAGVHDRSLEVPAGQPLGRPFQPADEAAADEPHVRQRVLERGRDEHHVLGAQRPCHLRVLLAVARDAAGGGKRRLQRLERNWIRADVSRLEAARVRDVHELVAEPREDHDPQVEALTERLDRVLERERVLAAPVDGRRHRGGDGLQLRDLRVDQTRLELGNDGEIDDGERSRDDPEEGEADLHAEAETRLPAHQASRKR
jgi:hypothetical protein